MKRHHFTCPSCFSDYDIWTYNIGMSDVNAELCCEKCPTVMIIDIYSELSANVRKEIYGDDNPKSLEEALLKKELSLARFGDLVGPCHCGGRFSHHELHKCPNCKSGIPMEEIKRQIGGHSSGGRPGVVMKDYMDETGRRRQPEE